MSLQFWISLIIAVIVLVAALLFVNQSKFMLIRRLRAARLRKKIIPKMQTILPIVSDVLRSNQSDLFLLFRLRADLEGLVLKADVLFEIERTSLIKFLRQLSVQIGEFESGGIANENINELVMIGERVIVELTELA